MSIELKLCPFCGCAAAITTRDVELQGDSWYGEKKETFVLCDCGACLFDGGFHEGFYDADTRAVEAWNRRAVPQDAPVVTDAMVEAALRARTKYKVENGLLRATDAPAMRAALSAALGVKPT